jgi:hypothetical protein
METIKNKIAYKTPTVNHIVIDNEISLILVSGSPEEPVAMNESPTYFNSGPFKTEMA